MRRMMCILAAMMLCFCLVVPAMAAESSFVPSIDYKDGPEIIEAEMGEDDLIHCLVVTSIPEARNASTNIYQKTRDLLLAVYEALSNGSMTLPLEDDYVIRELVDVSFMVPCVERDNHEEQLEQEGVAIDLTFDLGVAADENVVVLAYKNGDSANLNGEWKFVPVVNNGNGTVTCTFEHFCPVAFCVGGELPPAQTGDVAGQNLIVWFVLMAVSSAAVVILLINRRKFMR